MSKQSLLKKFLFPVKKVGGHFRTLRHLYLIRSSGLFDKDFYLKDNPDVASSGVNPALHYLHQGGFEGRNPGPNFSSSWYLDTYQDVKETGINPLVHYLKYGRAEGRMAIPFSHDISEKIVSRDLALIRSSGMFNEIWYLANNPDVAKAGIDPVLHYLIYGGLEGRDPSPSFHSSWYLEAYKDVKKTGINPLIYYLRYGRENGRDRGYEEGREAKFFMLRKMYDYSKEAGYMIFEDTPERIYLQGPQVIGSYSGELNEGEALCPPAYVSVIENAVIFGGSSLVIAQQEVLLSDEMMDFSSEEIGIKSILVKIRRENTVMLEYKKESNLHIKEGILLSCDHDNNYFHWLMECLPKLLMLDELDQFKGVPLLIPKGLHQNLEEALRRINIHERQLIYVDLNTAYQVERLVYPSALSRIIDRYQGRTVFDTDIVLSHKWISRVGRLLRRNTNYHEKPWRKLYLARRNSLRVLQNQDQLESMLLRQSFEIVELDRMTLEDQIKLFSQASLIVAPSGAALTNMMFSQPGTKVFVFMPHHEATNYYLWSSLGAIAGLEVTIISCKRLFTRTDYWSVHDDYVVDIELVQDEVKKYELNQQLRTGKVFDFS